MDLIINLFVFLLNAIISVFTNAWTFLIVFMIIGIAAVFNKEKGAGAVCIILAIIVFINIVS